MKISTKQLNSFIELYRKKYGVVLSDQEALEKAIRFLRLVELIEAKA